MPRQRRHKRRTQRGGFWEYFTGSTGNTTTDYTSSYNTDKKKGWLENLFSTDSNNTNKSWYNNMFGESQNPPSYTAPNNTASYTAPNNTASYNKAPNNTALTSNTSSYTAPNNTAPNNTLSYAGITGGKRTKRRSHRKRKSRRRHRK